MCTTKKTRGLCHVPERRYFSFSPGRFSEIVAILTAPAVYPLILSLTGGGPIGPPLFQRPVAQKVMKLKEIGKISYSMEIVLALKLSLGVSSKKVVLYK